MKYLYLTGILIFCLSNQLSAQLNLAPNPSFEDYEDCPFGLSCVESSATTFNYVQDWMLASLGSSDYFNSCASSGSGVSVPANIFSDYTPPHTGDAYVGFYQCLLGTGGGFEYREYVQTHLTDTLNAGECYYVEFYASNALKLSDASFGFLFTSDDVQAYFSAERPYDDFSTYIIDADPQISNMEGNYFTDTAEWTLVCGFFEAEGDEQWLTIGNFKPDEESDDIPILDDVFLTDYEYVYLFIDDVMVTPLDSLISAFLKDTVICSPLELTAPSCGSGYLWSTGDTTQTIIVTESGDYWLEIESPCGAVRDTATITFVIDSTYTTSQNVDVCFNDLPYTLESTLPYDFYDWSTGSADATIDIEEEGIYYVTGFTDCASFADTFHVHIITSQEALLNLGNDTLICADDWALQLDATDNFDNYIWSTGETTSSISVNGGGIYSVEITTACELLQDTITITEDPYLNSFIELGEDKQLCPPGGINSFILAAGKLLPNYLWSTGETDSSIVVNEPGIYWLQSDLLCSNIADSVIITLCDDIYIPNAFSPNGDGINDILNLILTDASVIITFQIYDRWGENVFNGNASDYAWDGTFNGKQMPAGVYVYVIVYKDGGQQKTISGNVTLVR